MICVPVNVLNSAREVEAVIVGCGARCLVLDEGAAERVADISALPELVVSVGPVSVSGTIDYEALLSRAAASPLPGPGSGELAMLYYTSGTTGAPKAAAQTHAGILWNAFQQVPDFGLTDGDRYLSVPSFSWAAGFHNLVLTLWWLGGSSVVLPTGGVRVDRIARTAATEHCTHTFLVPTLLKQLLDAPDLLDVLRASSLRWIISGAEPVPTTVLEQLNAELPGCQVVQGYGLSEFPTVATMLQTDEAISHAGSAGRAGSVTQMAIRDADGAIVESGEGEVLLRSLATMKEYYRNPEATAEVFQDDWLNTGDLGRVDEDGYLTITGRKRDLIISGGLNIYPKEIEDVLYRIDGVLEASVVGVPDGRWGEVPVAVVVPGPGGPSEDDVLGAFASLAGYKRPRSVLFRDEPLPRTATGKVLKRDIAPWARAQLESTT